MGWEEYSRWGRRSFIDLSGIAASGSEKQRDSDALHRISTKEKKRKRCLVKFKEEKRMKGKHWASVICLGALPSIIFLSKKSQSSFHSTNFSTSGDSFNFMTGCQPIDSMIGCQSISGYLFFVIPSFKQRLFFFFLHATEISLYPLYKNHPLNSTHANLTLSPSGKLSGESRPPSSYLHELYGLPCPTNWWVGWIYIDVEEKT